MLTSSYNLAFVDNHTLFRKTLKNYLSEQKAINVAIQASDMSDLFNQWNGCHIDILLIDPFMPGLSGQDAIVKVKKERPNLKILVLSGSKDLDFICDLLDFGIHGYISKSDEPEELLQAIRAVSENQICRSYLFTEALYRNRQNNDSTRSTEFRNLLSEREKRILQLLWEEKSNKEIADELFLGIRTVERIRQDIKEKLGVDSTIGMIKFGLESKIIVLTTRQFQAYQSVPSIAGYSGTS